MKKNTVFLIIFTIITSFLFLNQTTQAQNRSQFINMSNPPATMRSGERIGMWVEMKNTGPNKWKLSENYGLASTNPFNNNNWEVNFIKISNPVVQGSHHRFNFTITAPNVNVPTTYDYAWRMKVNNTGQFFGQKTHVRTVTVKPNNNAQFMSILNLPETMFEDQIVTVTIRMKNTGTSTWRSNYNHKLGSQNPKDNRTWMSNTRVYLSSSDNIAPGQIKDFTFQIKAPSTPGNYNFQWQMVQDGGGGWFGQLTPNRIITVIPKTNAQFISYENLPTQMAPNETKTITVKLKNTGNTTWTRDERYKLGTQNPRDNKIWTGATRIYLDENENISPGQTKDFTFQIKAPMTPGSYNFQWQMVQDAGEGWFGDLTQNRIIVIPVVNGAIAEDYDFNEIVEINESIPVIITMKNDGNTVWQKSNNYKLRLNNTSWTGSNSVELEPTEIISYNNTKDFIFNISTPSNYGDYNFNWQMIQEGNGLFGEGTDVELHVEKKQNNKFLRNSGGTWIFYHRDLNKDDLNAKELADKLVSGNNFTQLKKRIRKYGRKGAEFIRLWIPWSVVEPTENSWDFNPIKTIIDEIIARESSVTKETLKLDIQLCFNMYPQWFINKINTNPQNYLHNFRDTNDNKIKPETQLVSDEKHYLSDRIVQSPLLSIWNPDLLVKAKRFINKSFELCLNNYQNHIYSVRISHGRLNEPNYPNKDHFWHLDHHAETDFETKHDWQFPQKPDTIKNKEHRREFITWYRNSKRAWINAINNHLNNKVGTNNIIMYVAGNSDIYDISKNSATFQTIFDRFITDGWKSITVKEQRLLMHMQDNRWIFKKCEEHNRSKLNNYWLVQYAGVGSNNGSNSGSVKMMEYASETGYFPSYPVYAQIPGLMKFDDQTIFNNFKNNIKDNCYWGFSWNKDSDLKVKCNNGQDINKLCWPKLKRIWTVTRRNTNCSLQKNSSEVELSNSVEAILTEYSLSQNYPNPFNPSTNIKYSIPQNSFVNLEIFNSLGEMITTLENSFKTAGNYEIKFDASNLAGGVYFYRLRTNSMVLTKKMLLLK